jgi:hypothetical protein
MSSIDTTPITTAINDNMGLFVMGGVLLVLIVGFAVGIKMLGKLTKHF